MVEMSVIGIALDAASRSPIVLLCDPSRRRQVPIWIDQAQAHNIIAGLIGEPSPRPFSHDLMVRLLAAGDLHLERVIIHAIEDSTFRAVLKLSHDASSEEIEDPSDVETLEENEAREEHLDIDARPSDAIALAIRTGSSIWMLEEVVAEASIAVDAEADAEDRNEFRRFLDQVSPAAMVRHLQSRHPKDEETDDDQLRG